MAVRKKLTVAVHPILIGLYPILALLAGNLDQVRPAAALRAGLFSLAFCLAMYGALKMILRDTAAPAVLSSFWLVLFYTYGHLYQATEGQALFGFVFGKHRYLLIFWLVLFACGSGLIFARRRRLGGLNPILNLASGLLLVFPLLQIGQFAIQAQAAAAVRSPQGTGAALAGAQANTPNIYYIILDGYTRADAMRERYGLDISPFMEDLRSLGFVFPRCAQSNYGMTAFSMFASLNMEYLDVHADTIPLGSSVNQVDTLTMHEYLRHNKVRQFLAERGYQMVSFDTGYWWLDIDDADVYIIGSDNPLEKYQHNFDISAFEEMFLRTTILRVPVELLPLLTRGGAANIRTANQLHYEITSFALDQLEQTPRIPGKKFVYFHLVAPHAPFVFDAQGNFVDYDQRSGDIPGYPDEVAFLNKRISSLVRAIIDAEETPPIIILQSDHGWDPRDRMKILSAYYLPGGGDALLYPSITPVNTFRLVLSHYFGADLPLLEDASFFSIGHPYPELGLESLPYQMTPVPGSCMQP